MGWAAVAGRAIYAAAGGPWGRPLYYCSRAGHQTVGLCMLCRHVAGLSGPPPRQLTAGLAAASNCRSVGDLGRVLPDLGRVPAAAVGQRGRVGWAGNKPVRRSRRAASAHHLRATQALEAMLKPAGGVGRQRAATTCPGKSKATAKRGAANKSAHGLHTISTKCERRQRRPKQCTRTSSAHGLLRLGVVVVRLPRLCAVLRPPRRPRHRAACGGRAGRRQCTASATAQLAWCRRGGAWIWSRLHTRSSAGRLAATSALQQHCYRVVPYC